MFSAQVWGLASPTGGADAAVRADELLVSYLLNLTASILAVLNSEPVHLAVRPRVPSAARLLTPPSTSFCQGSQTVRNLCGCESERGGRAKVPSEAAESGAAARARPSWRVVKALDAFCPLCLWSRVTWSAFLAGNKWRCPAPPQALCAGNWTIAIVIIWILCRLTPTSIQILLSSGLPAVALCQPTCCSRPWNMWEQTRWRPFKGSPTSIGDSKAPFSCFAGIWYFPRQDVTCQDAGAENLR